MVHDLIRTVKVIEDYLNSDQSPLKHLKPRFTIAGSIIEGTRLVRADELDLSVEFEAMEAGHFEIGDTAMKYLVSAVGKSLLEGFCSDDGSLDMTKFLEKLLRTVLNCIQQEDVLPQNVRAMPGSTNWMPCAECKEKNEKDPRVPPTHCKNCIPAVAMTRAGPCIVLEYLESTLISIDIIPLFPSPEKNPVVLYNVVTRTLIREEPSGWRKYLKRFLKTDRILPESIALVGDTSKPYICMKIINFEADQSNFILRPGQILEIAELQDEMLKTVYILMKALKDHFKADVKSYFLKKVLLLPDHLAMAKSEASTNQQGQTESGELHKEELQLLFRCLSHPTLKVVFEKHIDYVKWKNNIEGVLRALVPSL